MITVKTIANRFLSSKLKPKVTIGKGGKVCAGFGVFDRENNAYEIPVLVERRANGMVFHKWDLDHSPIIEQREDFGFVGTMEELRAICDSEQATVEHVDLFLKQKTRDNSSQGLMYG